MNKKPENMTKAELLTRVRELEKQVLMSDVPPEDAMYRFLVAWNYSGEEEHTGFCETIDDDDPPYHIVFPHGDAWYNHARLATLEEVEAAGFVLPVSVDAK